PRLASRGGFIQHVVAIARSGSAVNRRYACGWSTSRRPRHRYDVRLEIHNLRDQRRQVLIGDPHFGRVVVPIVSAFNTADDMAKTPFGVFALHASARHEAACSSSKIM